MKEDFNRDWEFAKSDAEAPLEFLHGETIDRETVILPHTWNADDMVPGIEDAYIGIGWYSKTFEAPTLSDGQRVLIEFEAVAMTSRVWVNETYTGGRDDGYLSFDVDITDALKPGENRILVRADNRYDMRAMAPAHIDWNRYGGIHRPVWLHIKEAVHFSHCGIETRTPEVSEKETVLTVKTHVSETRRTGGKVSVKHILLDPDGVELDSVCEDAATVYERDNLAMNQLNVTEPRLWSIEKPVLYTLRSELLDGEKKLDSMETTVGFRYYEFDADQGFSLNGKPMKLCGVNQHIFYPGIGSAVPERYYDEELRLLKGMGCNFFRTSHYPRPKYFMDLCDRHGLLVMAEQPYWHGSVRSENGEAAIANSSRTLGDMIRQTGSHPSIILWNTVNEIAISPKFQKGVGHLSPEDPRRKAWLQKNTEWPYMRRACAVMVDTFKEKDPQRPVSLIVGGAWDLNDQAGLPLVADLIAYNGGACKLEQEETIHERTGLSFNWPPKMFRKRYPHLKHIGSEGILNHFGARRGDWEAELSQWKGQAREWDEIYACDWFSGMAMWVFSDYSSNGKLRVHCGGAVDRFRVLKNFYHFYRAMWHPEPVVHIVGHWNWTAGEQREVTVFTNCSGSELFLNGRSLGNGSSTAAAWPHLPNPPLVWKGIAFEPGELTARAEADGTPVEYTLHTHGEPAAVKLDLLTDDMISDGRDISYVTVQIVDENGILCRTWDGSACADVLGAAYRTGPKEVEVLAGIGRFAVRSNGTAGSVDVSVSADGLSAGSANLNAGKG